MTQLAMKLPERNVEHLERVSDRISGGVLEFCRRRMRATGGEFRMHELSAALDFSGMKCAPDSAGRILRDLRQKKSIGYEVLSRRDSLYRILWVK